MNTKLQKIRDIIAQKGVGGVLIERQNNFSWLTGGRGFIGLASEVACGSALVTKDKAYLVANNIEITRLIDEETSACDEIVPLSFLWHEESNRSEIIKQSASGEVLTDTQLAAEFFEMRTVLDSDEMAFFADFSIQAANILENAVKNVKVGMSEFELAGEISRGLWNAEIEPITLLIAFDERTFKYRHFLPTANKLKNYAIASICARKGGLIVSATRSVYLNGQIPDEITQKYQQLSKVYARLVNNTKPGAKLSDLFESIKVDYAACGYQCEENLHHQGGMTGYVARELRAMPNVDYIAKANQAYAWNPTITGTKLEDTIIIKENGFDILTHTGNYEYVEIDGVKIPQIINL